MCSLYVGSLIYAGMYTGKTPVYIIDYLSQYVPAVRNKYNILLYIPTIIPILPMVVPIISSAYATVESVHDYNPRITLTNFIFMIIYVKCMQNMYYGSQSLMSKLFDKRNLQCHKEKYKTLNECHNTVYVHALLSQ